jgi:hypothetical protein
MISPLEIHRAARIWGCGWFVAWTRLRCRQGYWASHAPTEDAPRDRRTSEAWSGRGRTQETSPDGR